MSPIVDNLAPCNILTVHSEPIRGSSKDGWINLEIAFNCSNRVESGFLEERLEEISLKMYWEWEEGERMDLELRKRIWALEECGKLVVPVAGRFRDTVFGSKAVQAEEGSQDNRTDSNIGNFVLCNALVPRLWNDLEPA